MNKCPPKPLLNRDLSESEWWRLISMQCFNTYEPRDVRRMGPHADGIPAETRIRDSLLWGGLGPWDFHGQNSRPWDIPEAIR